MTPKLLKQCVAEFIGTFALIFIGVGSIYNAGQTGNNMGLLGVALAHGLTIGVMIAAVGGICGGNLNPAVTFGLWVGGQNSFKQSIAYWIAQLAGGSAAAFLLVGIFSGGNPTGIQIVARGTPDLGPNIGMGQGIIIEAVLTFFLVFVVYGSAVDSRAPRLGGLAIGLTVALDILFGGPLTGGSMNPARTFGPALASGHWDHHLVYWIGPLLGGGLAGLVYGRYLIHDPQ